MTAISPNKVIIATAKLTSYSFASMSGAVAMIAELPQIALPMPMSAVNRRGMLSAQPARR